MILIPDRIDVDRLKPLDVAFMRTVHHKVNIVPVLAKADTLTKEEVLNLKRKVGVLSARSLSVIQVKVF